MSTNSATGSATPSSLYKLYKNCGAVAANPCTLRRQFAAGMDHSAAMNLNLLGLKGATQRCGQYSQVPTSMPSNTSHREQIQRSTSPPKLAFRQLTPVTNMATNRTHTVSLTLASLDMNRR